MTSTPDFVPVILGTNINAYNVARSIHEAYGVTSIALGRAPLPATRDSSIVDVRVDRHLDQPEVLVARLKELAAEIGDRPKVLFANIELYTNIVVAHRDEIGADYLVPLVGPDLAAKLMNKTDFYATCAELGVPHPESVIVRPGPLDGVGDALPVPYPVILKPSNTDIYPRLRFEGQQKVYLVEDAASLRDVAARIFAAGYDDDLVVQEYLAGDESVMRVVNTYSDRHGRMRFLSAGQVVLTEYDPREVGNNNAIVSIHDPALTDSVRRLLDGVGYTGLANLDVMLDRRTGENKILEVNLRLGATSYYTRAAGGNVTEHVVSDLVEHAELADTVTTAERLWVNVPYLVVLRFAPRALRPLLRAAKKRGGPVHTLRYRPDMTWRRRLIVAREDLRRSRNYVRYAGTRLNR